jgi:molecular chaperone GrpE
MYQITTAERDEIATQLDRLIRENAILQAKLEHQQNTAASVNNSLLLELLEVVDALDYLNYYLADNPNPPLAFHQRLPQSIRSISNKLESGLASYGVSPIDIPLNTTPDFNICKVVSHEVRLDLAPYSVVKVSRRGFYAADIVLRSAEVVISKTNPEN